MPRLTKRFVETIQPDNSKTLNYWNIELKGFGVIVLPSGRCIKKPERPSFTQRYVQQATSAILSSSV